VVRAALDQAARRLCIGLRQLVERDVAGAGVGDVRRDRSGAIGRSKGAHHVARARRVGGLGRIRGGTRQAGALAVDLANHGFEAVVGLGDPGGGERVGLDDVGTGIQVRTVDRGNDIGPSQADQIGVAAQVARVVTEALAPEVRLGQGVRLDERAHPAVEHEDPFAQQAVEAREPGRPAERRGHGHSGEGRGHGSELADARV
jgi:hypothetical protein